MPEDEFDTNEIAEALMSVGMMLEPIIEFAKGVKAKLVAEGWSDSVAGEVSGEVLRRVIILGMGGAK